MEDYVILSKNYIISFYFRLFIEQNISSREIVTLSRDQILVSLNHICLFDSDNLNSSAELRPF